MFDALVVLAQHALDTDRVPASHGARPRVAVTLDHQSLLTGLSTDPCAEALTDDGLRLSVAAVRRLACDADLIAVCLGTDGEVLDVGRTARLITPALWRALVARDRHCAFPGCTRPPVMGHAHHIVHWADGGKTSLDNLVLVCGEHHRVLHHTPWQVRLNPARRQARVPPPARVAHQAAARLDPPPTPTRVRVADSPAQAGTATVSVLDGRRSPRWCDRPRPPLRSNLVTGRSSHRGTGPPSSPGSASSTSRICPA